MNKPANIQSRLALLLGVAFVATGVPLQAQDGGKPAEEDLKLKSRKTYSPYANRHFPTNVYGAIRTSIPASPWMLVSSATP